MGDLPLLSLTAVHVRRRNLRALAASLVRRLLLFADHAAMQLGAARCFKVLRLEGMVIMYLI
eukprot:COSAG01_NODE_7132_length_3336_cov_3.598703_1_plen_62_part_00